MTGNVVNLAEYRAARPLGEHRGDRRHSVEGILFPDVTLDGKTGSIENLSRSGLMATVETNKAPGSWMQVAVPGCNPLMGKLIWKCGGRVGVEVPFADLQGA
jgi:hypothetical protein